MVQDTSVRVVTSGKRLPLPGLNPNSYSYLDSSSDSEDTYLGDDTDPETTISRTFLSGETLPKSFPNPAQRNLTSLSPFSSDLEDNELAFPRRRSGKSLKSILNLRKQINFEDLEEETEEEEDEIFGIKWERFSSVPTTSTQELYELERLRDKRMSSDIFMFNESKNSDLANIQTGTSESVPSMDSLLELTNHSPADQSPLYSYADSPLSSNPVLHITDGASFTVGLDSLSPLLQVPIENREVSSVLDNECIHGQYSKNILDEEFTSENPIDLGGDAYPDGEIIEWSNNTINVTSFPREILGRNKNFDRHMRYNPYDLKQTSQKISIRRKGRSDNPE